MKRKVTFEEMPALLACLSACEVFNGAMDDHTIQGEKKIRSSCYCPKSSNNERVLSDIAALGHRWRQHMDILWWLVDKNVSRFWTVCSRHSVKTDAVYGPSIYRYDQSMLSEDAEIQSHVDSNGVSLWASYTQASHKDHLTPTVDTEI